MGTTTVFGLPLGFFAAIQGSWEIIVLQLVVMIIVGVFWYPFFKKYDKDMCRQEQENLAIND